MWVCQKGHWFRAGAGGCAARPCALRSPRSGPPALRIHSRRGFRRPRCRTTSRCRAHSHRARRDRAQPRGPRSRRRSGRDIRGERRQIRAARRTRRAASTMPSMIRSGVRSKSSRSLKVAGSLSSALHTINFSSPRASRTSRHFCAAGVPAPPMPRSPACSSSVIRLVRTAKRSCSLEAAVSLRANSRAAW